MTVWFTGLPCSGKSTIASLVCAQMRACGAAVELLDGDAVRQALSPGLGFTKGDRDEHVRRLGFMCQVLNRHGVFAIVAAISPYRAAREDVRGRIRGFLEVYVRCPGMLCRARDVKGLYRQAAAGEITGFTGVDAPYEEPLHPELVVETDIWTPEHCAFLVLQKMREAAWETT